MIRSLHSSDRRIALALAVCIPILVASCQQPSLSTSAGASYIYSIGLLVDPGTPTSLQSVQYVDSSGTLQTLNNVALGPIDDPVWGTHFAHGWQVRVDSPPAGTALSFQATSPVLTPVIASLNVSGVVDSTDYYTFNLSPGIAAGVLEYRDYAVTNGTTYTGSFFGDAGGATSIDVTAAAGPPAAGAFTVYPLPTVVAGIYRVESGMTRAVSTLLNDSSKLGPGNQFSVSFSAVAH